MVRGYLIAKYRGATPAEVKENIRLAEEATESLWKLGVACYCRHLLTAFFEDEGNWEALQRGHRTWLAYAEVAYCLEGWGDDPDCMTEVEAARELEIPIVTSHTDLLLVLQKIKEGRISDIEPAQKAQDPYVGKTFAVWVGRQVVPVQIIAERLNGGWYGINLKSGRRLTITNPQRLLYRWNAGKEPKRKGDRKNAPRRAHSNAQVQK